MNKMAEKEVKVTDAKEARILTDQNSIKIDRILEQISNNAKYGRSSIVVMEECNHIVMASLIEKGFKIQKIVDPMGQDLLKVSW